MDKVEFINGTENNIPRDQYFDIVCTHFILDLFQQKEMETLMTKISSHTIPTSEWHFADFQNRDSFKQKFLLKIMYLFFRLTTNISANKLPNFSSAFKKLGWIEIESRFYNNGMIKSSVFKTTK